MPEIDFQQDGRRRARPVATALGSPIPDASTNPFDSGTGFNPMPEGPLPTDLNRNLHSESTPPQYYPPPTDLNRSNTPVATTVGQPITGTMSRDQVAQWMRSKGVSEHVIRDEATDNLLRYGSDLQGVLDRSLGGWLERSRGGSSASGAGTAGQSGSGASGGAMRVANTSPQFDDPAARLVEDYALDRFQQRQNPHPNSGTALYEQYLREFANTLKGAPYSPSEEAQIKQAAYNEIEGERAATKQRWIEEVSRRGHMPSSGVALDGLRKIENHFNQVRSTADNTFATNAINLTRANRAQAAGVLGSLATNEEGRLSDALQYAMLPVSLQDRSFNMGATLTGLGGNPQGYSQNAMGVLQMLNQANQMNAQNRQQFTSGLMQWLGYMFDGDDN